MVTETKKLDQQLQEQDCRTFQLQDIVSLINSIGQRSPTSGYTQKSNSHVREVLAVQILHQRFLSGICKKLTDYWVHTKAYWVHTLAHWVHTTIYWVHTRAFSGFSFNYVMDFSSLPSWKLSRILLALFTQLSMKFVTSVFSTFLTFALFFLDIFF